MAAHSCTHLPLLFCLSMTAPASTHLPSPFFSFFSPVHPLPTSLHRPSFFVFCFVVLPQGTSPPPSPHSLCLCDLPCPTAMTSWLNYCAHLPTFHSRNAAPKWMSASALQFLHLQSFFFFFFCPPPPLPATPHLRPLYPLPSPAAWYHTMYGLNAAVV